MGTAPPRRAAAIASLALARCGLSGATAIAAGGSHSLALLSNGTVMAWGSNGQGQLGNGNDTGPDSCAGQPCSTTPIPVGGLSGVVALAAGDYHSLALLSNGTVMAWGDNSLGQLGNGTTATQTTPRPVSGLSGVVAIAAGGFHSLALLSNGTVMAWGENTNGELGNGNNTGPDSCGGRACSETPIPVGGVSHVVGIAAGLTDSQSVALLSTGTPVDWGRNVNGELGNGTTTNPEPTPAPLGGLAGSRASPPGPATRRRSSQTEPPRPGATTTSESSGTAPPRRAAAAASLALAR